MIETEMPVKGRHLTFLSQNVENVIYKRLVLDTISMIFIHFFTFV